MDMREGFARSYSSAWGFVAAMPLLALVVVGVEGLQHVMEYAAGMYASRAGMAAEANDPGRMIAGSLKILWLLLLEFWVIRFTVGGSSAAALARDPVALRKFIPVLMVSAVVSLFSIFLPTLLMLGSLGPPVTTIVSIIVVIATVFCGILLIPWAVSAALGDDRAGLGFSVHRARGSIIWALVFGIVTPLPLIVVHYALGYGAVGKAPWLSISLLSIDAIFTSLLAVVAATSQVMIAERMAERAKDRLLCGPFVSVDHAPACFI